MEYLFVYGTLRSDLPNNYNILLSESYFVEKGFVFGKIYKINSYPGLVITENKENKIYGQIWEIHNPISMFKVLDHFEECSPEFPEPQEYKRKITTVTTDSGKKYNAWIYVYNQSTETLNQLFIQDFLETF